MRLHGRLHPLPPPPECSSNLFICTIILLHRRRVYTARIFGSRRSSLPRNVRPGASAHYHALSCTIKFNARRAQEENYLSGDRDTAVGGLLLAADDKADYLLRQRACKISGILRPRFHPGGILHRTMTQFGDAAERVLIHLSANFIYPERTSKSDINVLTSNYLPKSSYYRLTDVARGVLGANHEDRGLVAETLRYARERFHRPGYRLFVRDAIKREGAREIIRIIDIYAKFIDPSRIRLSSADKLKIIARRATNATCTSNT